MKAGKLQRCIFLLWFSRSHVTVIDGVRSDLNAKRVEIYEIFSLL